MSQEFHEVKVSRVIEESADARSFELDVPAALRERFGYSAGQFVTVELPWTDFQVRRCYSLSSAPGLDPAPRITVKRVPDGRVSGWLVERVAAGDTLRVSVPEGRFVLREVDAERPLTLWAAGSGITPILSLLKTALHHGARRVAMLYASRDAASVIFDHELTALEGPFRERFTLVRHLDQDHGFLNDAELDAFLAASRDGVHYVCGPTGFMDGVERALDRAGVPESHRHFERFVSPIDPDRLLTGEEVLADGPGELTVRLEGRRHRVPLAPGQTLLEAARAAGLRAPSSCESGYCGSCMAQRVVGEVHMRTREALSDRDVARGRILMCQSLARGGGPLEVDCDATSFRIDVSDGASLRLRRLIALCLALFVATAICILRSRG